MAVFQPPRYGVRPDGFRLPEDAHVGRVRLQVADLARSIEYYEHIIGLRAVNQSAGRAELSAGSRVLVELHERPGARPSPRRGTLGLFHFAILLPERTALGRFLRHSLEQGAASGMSDHAVSESVYLSDPDGLGIEVYADRTRSEWRTLPDRQLYLTTQPLKVDELVALGGESPWDEAPAGTTMGHVHLHVGDLDRSEAFYHRAVGFDKIAWSYPGALFFSAGGYHHHLGTNTWSSGAAAPDDQARLLSWHLETAEPDAVAASVTARGYSADRDGNGWRVADPWGTVMEIHR